MRLGRDDDLVPPAVRATALEPLVPPDRFRGRLGDVSGRGVTIGIVDSGFAHHGLVPDDAILPEHDIHAPVGAGRDRLTGGDRLGHGTACLTTAYRLAPLASFRSVRLFAEDLQSTPDELCAAIDAAASSGCRVVNLSLRVEVGGWAERVYVACERARAHGMILVAASHGERVVSLPAWFDNVLSVAAGSQADPFEFQVLPDGPIDIVAAAGIGGRIVTADGDFAAGKVPSYAAPVMSGIIALVLERYPNADLPAVRDVLRELAETA